MAEVLKKYKSIAAARKLPTVADPDFKEGIELLIQSAMISKISKPRFSLVQTYSNKTHLIGRHLISRHLIGRHLIGRELN